MGILRSLKECEPRGIHLGIAPINWCNDDMPELGSETSLEQCLSEMREAGFSGTEIGNKYPRQSKALQEVLKAHNLRLASCWHSTFYADWSRHKEQNRALEARVQFLAELGTERINLAECTSSVHGRKDIQLGRKPRLNSQEWSALLKGLDGAGEICQRYGITMAYHHHMGTVIQNEDEIVRLLEESDPRKVSLCLDTGHLAFAGIDPLQILERYHSRISHIHLKDIRREVVRRLEPRFDHDISFLDAVLEGVFTVPGDGSLDFRRVIRRLTDLSYSGWLIVEAEQDPAKAHPFTYAQKAYQHIREIQSSLEMGNE